ncbi:MAG: hypothetical protein K8T25_08875 [Planctomycetia bacterium]|nr:hypothetical protein [Planctomycetia bacterium]
MSSWFVIWLFRWSLHRRRIRNIQEAIIRHHAEAKPDSEAEKPPLRRPPDYQ